MKSGEPSSTPCNTKSRATPRPSARSPASTGTTGTQAATTASAAARRCSCRTPSSTPVLLATIVMSIATIVQVTALKLMRRQVHLMLWITLALVVVLGSATIWFHNPVIIKWKPSIAYWALGISFWFSRALFHRDLLQEMLGEELMLPAIVWQRLNFAWVAFLGLMGLLNLYVAYSFSTSTWASFKVFGATGLMLAFSIGQVVYLSRYIKPEADESKPPKLPS